MEDLQEVIQIGKKTVRLTWGENTVPLSLEPNYSREKEYDEGMDIEDFTSDSSAIQSFSSEDEPEESYDAETELVVIIKGVSYQSPPERALEIQYGTEAEERSVEQEVGR